MPSTLRSKGTPRRIAVEVREDGTDELSAHFQVDVFKVEIKTTTMSEARLTPLQAATCAKDADKFVLCVVDLRGFEGDVHQVDWDTLDVSDFCRFVSGRSLPIDETLSLVRDAEGGEVPIRNVSELRYAIRSDLWQEGFSIAQWVADTFPSARPLEREPV